MKTTIFDMYSHFYNNLSKDTDSVLQNFSEVTFFAVNIDNEINESESLELFRNKVNGQSIVDVCPTHNIFVKFTYFGVPSNYILLSNTADGRTMSCCSNESVGQYETVRIVEFIIFKLQSRDSRVALLNEPVKTKTGRNKVIPIIHISDKRNITIYQNKFLNNKKVDWKHSWQVIGHWRKINPLTLGKDKNGIYNQEGRTWVNPSIRGSGELVRKLRIIK